MMRQKSSILWFARFIITISSVTLAAIEDIRSRTSPVDQKGAAQDVVKRLLPERYSEFQIQVKPDLVRDGKLEKFQVNWDEGSGRIVCIGTSATAALFGFHQYLKYQCKCHVAWEGSQLELPNSLPHVTLDQVIYDRFRYFENTCTESYSYVWWDWEEWEKHIDWMALNGINMPLALTGQEAIWLKVYNSFGLTSEQVLNEFFTGPAFLAWWRMSNVLKWGGPIPRYYMNRKLGLLKKVVRRMRSLGMTPILPAFSGVVPPGFKAIYPQADVIEHYTSWNNFNTTYSTIHMLQPTDPLFRAIGKRFITELISELGGTDHIYSCDPFVEIQPTRNDSVYLGQIGRLTYESMAAADDKAVWLLQSWMLKYTQFWKMEQARSYLNGIPKGKLLILDTEAELFPRYHLFQSFFNHSFIWCMLNNFGENHGLHGGLGLVNDGVPLARVNSTSLVGTGMCPEGINQNYFIYDFMSEASLRKSVVNITQWTQDYHQRRYGISNPSLSLAWLLLEKSLYNAPPGVRFHGRTIITQRPSFRMDEKVWYDPSQVVEALGYLTNVSTKEKNGMAGADLYHFDLVDVSRQVLQNLVDKLHTKLVESFLRNQRKVFESTANNLMQVLSDMDTILATHPRWLLGPWIKAAERWATSKVEEDLLRFNALNQLTLWGPLGETTDYAAKMWSGMVSQYYKPRWAFFIDRLRKCWQDPTYTFSQYQYEILNFIEIPFSTTKISFPVKENGDSHSEAKRVYSSWKGLALNQTGHSQSAAGQRLTCLLNTLSLCLCFLILYSY